jgi:hypothetical protein
VWFHFSAVSLFVFVWIICVNVWIVLLWEGVDRSSVWIIGIRSSRKTKPTLCYLYQTNSEKAEKRNQHLHTHPHTATPTGTRIDIHTNPP